jgi:uncharacterized protein (UPF0332 family)
VIGYIEEAREFLEEAKREFREGVEADKIMLVRDACEKAWNATVISLNALFTKKGVSPLPKSHRERRIKVRELEMVDEQVRNNSVFDRFMARDHILHERGFYDGDVINEEIEEELTKVEKFINDIDSLT